MMRWIGTILVGLGWLMVGLGGAVAQEDFPPLTETFEGRGRLNDVNLQYPEGWYTLSGVPVNRLISFNVISSVPLGLRNRIVAGQEAVVVAIAGGRIDRWGRLDEGATAEAVLTVFFEQLGDDNRFGGAPEESAEGAEFEAVIETFEVNGREGVRVRYVDTAETEAEAGADSEADEEAFSGDFAAYALLLDENQFMVMLVLTSEYSFEEVEPTLEAMLASLTFGG